VTRSFPNLLRAHFAYLKRHPLDCLLHGIEHYRLLRELQGLAPRAKSCPLYEGGEAYRIQLELMNNIWDGYSDLRGWLYLARASKLRSIKEDIESKLRYIESLHESVSPQL
jgi:hypothetical protein